MRLKLSVFSWQGGEINQLKFNICPTLQKAKNVETVEQAVGLPLENLQKIIHRVQKTSQQIRLGRFSFFFFFFFLLFFSYCCTTRVRRSWVKTRCLNCSLSTGITLGRIQASVFVKWLMNWRKLSMAKPEISYLENTSYEEGVKDL